MYHFKHHIIQIPKHAERTLLPVFRSLSAFTNLFAEPPPVAAETPPASPETITFSSETTPASSETPTRAAETPPASPEPIPASLETTPVAAETPPADLEPTPAASETRPIASETPTALPETPPVAAETPSASHKPTPMRAGQDAPPVTRAVPVLPVAAVLAAAPPRMRSKPMPGGPLPVPVPVFPGAAPLPTPPEVSPPPPVFVAYRPAPPPVVPPLPPAAPRPVTPSPPPPPPAADTKPVWHTAAWILGGLAGLVLVGALGYLLYLRTDLPPLRRAQPNTLNLATIAYTADGEELARFYREHRVWMSHAHIAPAVIDALVATEDHRFFAHDGVDLWRMIGSAMHTAQGDLQGGSTLTMQLVRNFYPEIGQAPGIQRKLQEMMMASKMEQRYTKAEIVEMYLNTVPFGYNAFGIEAAAQTYFGKSAADLDAREGATLVGMLKGTSRYNPVRHPDRARARRNVVLGQMLKHGYLSRARHAALREAPLGLAFEMPSLATSPAPYFAEHVRAWLEAWAEANGYNPYTDGLRVYTTLDLRLQTMAEEAVAFQTDRLQAVADYEWGTASRAVLAHETEPYMRARGRLTPFAYFWSQNTRFLAAAARESVRYRRALARGLDPEATLTALLADPLFTDSLRAAKTRLEAGLVAIDPATGHVKAWVGGRDFAQDRFDKVALARRQPGSTFKPFVYARAFERGYSPYTTLQDTVRTFRLRATGQRWTPRNAGGWSSGAYLTLRQGLAWSKNTITAQLIDRVGPSGVADLARRMGVESELLAVPSLGLGTSETTLLEMVAAYTTFARMGNAVPPVVVTRVEDRAGNVLAEFAPTPRPALTPNTAYTVLDILRDVTKPGGTGADVRRRYGIVADVAGKTGTTQNNTDGWFIMMHPELVVGAWVGFNDQRVRFRSNYWGQGGHNALHLVGDFFRRALDAPHAPHADARFSPPNGYVVPRPLYREEDEYNQFTGTPGSAPQIFIVRPANADNAVEW